MTNQEVRELIIQSIKSHYNLSELESKLVYWVVRHGRDGGCEWWMIIQELDIETLSDEDDKLSDMYEDLCKRKFFKSDRIQPTSSTTKTVLNLIKEVVKES